MSVDTAVKRRIEASDCNLRNPNNPRKSDLPCVRPELYLAELRLRLTEIGVAAIQTRASYGTSVAELQAQPQTVARAAIDACVPALAERVSEPEPLTRVC